ncbi:MAG: hypothetical protein LBL58_09820 [Tannerellaceae bacterium]|jgi:hypothetical protein|nr:hypothetical protein [Tannerellaceae bacterium]
MKKISRLEFLKTTGLATAGMMLGGKVSAEALDKEGIHPVQTDGLPQVRQQLSAEQQAAALAQQNTLKVPVTAKGKIGDMTFSRLILGGNPIGGWLHSRDLNYVGSLARAYLTDDKKMQIFQMAENCGIDTILGHPIMIDILSKYWSKGIGKIKWISDCGSGDFATAAQQSIDGGCAAGYCQGEMTDRLVQQGDFKSIGKGLDILRKAGLPAGIGAHHIASLKACVANGVIPDFWMKTLHHHNYWSARPGEPARDNRYCDDPEGTITFFESRKEPFIAFKVLAAGAIPPADGIKYGLENGGDFVCLGMFDFNMIQDVNIFNETLANLVNRKRPWCA